MKIVEESLYTYIASVAVATLLLITAYLFPLEKFLQVVDGVLRDLSYMASYTP
ncbi:MAG: hypothetical protein ACK4M3_03165 [Pyrobaculum sp.]